MRRFERRGTILRPFFCQARKVLHVKILIFGTLTTHKKHNKVRNGFFETSKDKRRNFFSKIPQKRPDNRGPDNRGPDNGGTNNRVMDNRGSAVVYSSNLTRLLLEGININCSSKNPQNCAKSFVFSSHNKGYHQLLY